MIDSGQYQRSTRGRLPRWFLERPPSMRTDPVYLTAYYRLSTERRESSTSRPGPIPWSAVHRYARSLGFDAIMTEHVTSVLMRLDAAYRDHVAQQVEEQERRAKRKQEREARRAAGKGGGASAIERRRQSAAW